MANDFMEVSRTSITDTGFLEPEIKEVGGGRNENPRHWCVIVFGQRFVACHLVWFFQQHREYYYHKYSHRTREELESLTEEAPCLAPGG